jgi:hypothetical protein
MHACPWSPYVRVVPAIQLAPVNNSHYEQSLTTRKIPPPLHTHTQKLSPCLTNKSRFASLHGYLHTCYCVSYYFRHSSLTTKCLAVSLHKIKSAGYKCTKETKNVHLNGQVFLREFIKGEVRVVIAVLTVISEVHCRVYEIPQPVTSLYHVNLVNKFIPCSFKIHFIVIRQYTPTSMKWYFPLSSLTKILIHFPIYPCELHTLFSLIFYVMSGKK